MAWPSLLRVSGSSESVVSRTPHQKFEMLIEMVIKVTDARVRFYRAVEHSDPTRYELGRQYEAALDEYLSELRLAMNECVADGAQSVDDPAPMVNSASTKENTEGALTWAYAEKEKVRRIRGGWEGHEN